MSITCVYVHPCGFKARFDRFVQVAQEPGRDVISNADSPPAFTTSFFYHQESEGSIILTLQQPGIVYYGATPAFNGRQGQCTAGGEYDGAPSYHPLALVLKGPNGTTMNQTIPANFQGTVHQMTPLRSPHQFCILRENITLFNGCKVFIPLCRPDPKNEIPHQPKFVSMVAPTWLNVYPASNATCPTCSLIASVNSTTNLGNGMRRTTFAAKGGRWSTYNNNVPIYVTFAPSFVGRDAPSADNNAVLWVMIHDDVATAAATPVGPKTPWQRLVAHTVHVPTDLVLPQTFVTSITWTDASLLLDGPVGRVSGGGGGFLQLYKSLGFNTVPLVSAPVSGVPS